MRLTMNERKKATAVLAPRYQRARKKEKGKILDEAVKHKLTEISAALISSRVSSG